MRKLVVMLVAGVSCVGWVAAQSPKTETVTGQVIDLYCYTRNKAFTGMNHGQERECARSCVKYEGQPVGLLTSAGKVYQLGGGLVANNNAKIAPYVTRTVTVTGEVTTLDGMPLLAANDVSEVKNGR